MHVIKVMLGCLKRLKTQDSVPIFSTLQNYNKYCKSKIKKRARYVRNRVLQQISHILHVLS